MLVLSRRVGQQVETSCGLKITVVEVRGDKVRLGLEAPPAITILRSEVAERILAGGELPLTRAGELGETARAGEL